MTCSCLNVVQVAQQGGFLHAKVVGDECVEAVGQVEDLGLGRTV